MRKIITTTFVTLDGVMQAPGGPKEDVSGGFKYGGWLANLGDPEMWQVMDGFMKLPFELLLGAKTYDIFASYWPTATVESQVAVPFNKTVKYVVSHDKNKKTPWNNSVLITGDVVSEIKKLKEKEGPDMWIHGSGNLIQTLLDNNLIDQMHIWSFPVTVGEGKRLFAGGAAGKTWKVIEVRNYPSGASITTYEPLGELKTGTIGE
jgi:dihydrofolate reductase